jgi:hypothetical protein
MSSSREPSRQITRTKLEHRAKVLAHDYFRHRVGNTDVQTKRTLPWLLTNRGQKLSAQGKDFFGILQNLLSGVGQDQSTSRAGKKRRSPRLLEPLELCADTWLRNVPGVGLADDVILVKRVVARHGRKLARNGLDF